MALATQTAELMTLMQFRTLQEAGGAKAKTVGRRVSRLQVSVREKGVQRGGRLTFGFVEGGAGSHVPGHGGELGLGLGLGKGSGEGGGEEQGNDGEEVGLHFERFLQKELGAGLLEVVSSAGWRLLLLLRMGIDWKEREIQGVIYFSLGRSKRPEISSLVIPLVVTDPGNRSRSSDFEAEKAHISRWRYCLSLLSFHRMQT